MKKIIINSIYLSILLTLGSCLNYETQADGPYDPNEEQEILMPSVVYVSNGNVYLGDQFLRDSIIIDDSGQNTLVSINNNHTKVLFKRANQNIQVYDIESASLDEEVPNSEAAFWFEYHSNNKTIYYLIGNEIVTVGENILEQNPLNLVELAGFPNATLNGAGVNNNKDIAFSITYTESGQVNHNNYLYSDNGLDPLLIISNQAPPLEYFRFDRNGEFLCSANKNNSDVYVNRTENAFSFSGTYSFVEMATPVTERLGYFVLANNSIQAINQIIDPSAGMAFTAIDF